MRTLQERWKPVAAAPRSQAEVLWTRFKTAQEQVYDKCKDFFAQQAAERVENLKKKETLCAARRIAARFDRLGEDGRRDEGLQAEWKTIGPVTRGNEKAVWERFRAACDKFFTRRQEDLKQRKQDWTENLKQQGGARRRGRAARRSRPSGSRPPSRIKQLQVEWKSDRSGEEEQVGRDLERVPRRVRSVLRAIQESRSGRRSQGKLADRETAVAELEALLPAADRRTTRRAGRSLRRRCRRRARAGCRGRSCRATRWRRSPIASMPRSSRW